jgi:hypothetical protein
MSFCFLNVVLQAAVGKAGATVPIIDVTRVGFHKVLGKVEKLVCMFFWDGFSLVFFCRDFFLSSRLLFVPSCSARELRRRSKRLEEHASLWLNEIVF